MSPRALAALSDATRMAESAERRCRALRTFGVARGADLQCESAAVKGSFCWAHHQALLNPNRRGTVERA